MDAWPEAARPIRRVLELARPTRPRAVAAARDALTGALQGVRDSIWPEVAWCFSRINGDGFPLEFTFSSLGDGLRYTVEMAGPELDESRRRAAALRWAGWETPSADLARELAGWPAGPLRWGAWGGGFHSESASRRKVYVEVPPGATPPPRAAILPRAVWRFIGLGDGGREREYYFRRDYLETAEVGRLARALAMRECFAPLCECVAETLPWPIHSQLVPASAGFSLAPGRALSLFTYGANLWGGDGSIRRHLLELAAKRGWDFRLYEAVTRPLERAPGPRASHGILAWIARPGQPVELRVSVRPPG
jgi:hypothetical protein